MCTTLACRVSRARHEAVIYTDDHKNLADAVTRASVKTATLEIKQLAEHGHDRGGKDTGAVKQRQDIERSNRHPHAKEDLDMAIRD